MNILYIIPDKKEKRKSNLLAGLKDKIAVQNNNSPFSPWRFKCKMDRNRLSHFVLHIDSNEDPHQPGHSPKKRGSLQVDFQGSSSETASVRNAVCERIENTGNKLLFGQLLTRAGPDTSPSNHPINNTFPFRNQNVSPWPLQLSFLP